MNAILRKIKDFRSSNGQEERFIRKSAGASINISYETEIKQESPGPNLPPYHHYRVLLLLTCSNERGRDFVTEIANGTMTQNVDTIVNDSAREAIRRKIPELIGLFKKYGVHYAFDEKTKKLLQADMHLIKLNET